MAEVQICGKRVVTPSNFPDEMVGKNTEDKGKKKGAWFNNGAKTKQTKQYL
ncbi:MAG: hypothetical protein ACI3Z5_00210 [Paludibacteraceae bacterium]